MRVLAPVMEGAALTVFDPWQPLALGCAIAFPLLRDDDLRHVLQPLKELTEKLLGRLLVALTLP
jgi:hypothetical protein